MEQKINTMVINATNVMDDVTIIANDVMVNGEKVAELTDFLTNPEICDYARKVSKQVKADFNTNGKTSRILKVEDKGFGEHKLTLQIGKLEYEYIECRDEDGTFRFFNLVGFLNTCTDEELLIGKLPFDDFGDILLFKTYDEEGALLVSDMELKSLSAIKEGDIESLLYSISLAQFNRNNNEFTWEPLLSKYYFSIKKLNDATKQYIEDWARSCAGQIGK